MEPINPYQPPAQPPAPTERVTMRRIALVLVVLLGAAGTMALLSGVLLSLDWLGVMRVRGYRQVAAAHAGMGGILGVPGLFGAVGLLLADRDVRGRVLPRILAAYTT